jgi:hypothetical protein
MGFLDSWGFSTGDEHHEPNAEPPKGSGGFLNSWGFGNKDESHTTPCDSRDDGGWWWIRRDPNTGENNPMGWGSNASRVVVTGGEARRQRMKNEPSSHAQARPSLGAIDWGTDSGFIPASGDKPGRGRNRPGGSTRPGRGGSWLWKEW